MPEKLYPINANGELAQLIKTDFEVKLKKKVNIKSLYSSGKELKVIYEVVKGENKS